MRTLLNVATLPQNSYNKNNYKSIPTGTSDCNEYIPVFAIINHELIVFKTSEVKIMEYSMPLANNNYTYIRQYAHVLDRLESTLYPVRYIFKAQGVSHNLYIDRGIIFNEQGEILLSLAINTKYLFSLSKEDFEKGELDSDKFVLFLSKELDNPIYKNLKKKLDTLYINEAIVLGIDVVISSKIPNWIFKNNVEPIKFKSVAELNKHLKQEVPMRILEM